MTTEQNLATARDLADKILQIDAHSAQLRLVHLSALRDGLIDPERLHAIQQHLKQITNLLGTTLPLAAVITPTITLEASAQREEKETQ